MFIPFSNTRESMITRPFRVGLLRLAGKHPRRLGSGNRGSTLPKLPWRPARVADQGRGERDTCAGGRSQDSARSTDLRFSTVLRDSNEKWLQEVNIDPQSTRVGRYSVTLIDLKIDETQFEGLAMSLEGFLVVSAAPETTNGEAMGIAPGTLHLTVSKPTVLPSKLLGTSPLNRLISVPFIQYSRKRAYPGLHQELGLLTYGRDSHSCRVSERTRRTSVPIGPAIRCSTADRRVIPVLCGNGRFRSRDIQLVAPPEAHSRPCAACILLQGRRPRGRLVYILKSPSSARPAGASTEPQLQGYVSTFLLSSALTLGALLGQLFVAGILIYQIDTALSDLGQTLLIGAIAVIGVLAARYIGYTVYLAVKDRGERRESLKHNKPRLFRNHYTYEDPQTSRDMRSTGYGFGRDLTGTGTDTRERGET